jgi:hypothetical protein
MPRTNDSGIMRFMAIIPLFVLAAIVLSIAIQSCSPSVMRTLYLPPNVTPDTIGPEYLHNVSLIKYWDRISPADRATNFGWWDSAGTVRETSQYYNKVIVLTFFGTWSPPSVGELNVIDSARESGDTNVLFLAVAMKEGVTGGKAVLRIDSFASVHGIPYEVLVGSPDFGFTYGGIDVVPTTFVITLRRKIATTIEGFATKAKLLEAIGKAEAAE